MFALHVKPGLDIRLLERRHAAAVYARVNGERRHIGEWLPWAETTESPRDVELFIEKALAKFAANNGFDAGLWLHGEVVGGIGTHYYDWVNRKTEIGYWLSQTVTGQGIMTDCCREVIRYVFEDLQLHRVEVRCATANVKSRRVPERLGFTFEGTLRSALVLHSGFVDMAVYGLLRTDQAPSRSSAV